MTASTFTANPAAARQVMVRIEDAVVRAGIRVRDEIVAQFAARGGGYTTGDWATGAAADIALGPLERDGQRRSITVSTTARRDGRSYPAYWELGHWNVFTRRYERVETFRPAAEIVAGEFRGIVRVQFTRLYGGVAR